MPCVWTHCIDPPTADPVNVTQLEPVWDGEPVNFDSVIDYKCRRGMKFFDNFHLTEQKANCKPENVWETPVTAGGAWKQCVETKYCAVPPEAPVGGSVKVFRSVFIFVRINTVLS